LFSRFTASRTSIAAQGGINAAKNYQGDGDSVFRLFYETVKGGDYRARESNVHRLAEVSAKSLISAFLRSSFGT
jgi:succinate dehydrogenase/fumarate reductase flavoprotein subunit